MLSVLIPVYNYDITRLVNRLHEQLIANDIIFEIIILDDGSTNDCHIINAEIEKLSHTCHIISSSNCGRVATRQKLAEQAKHEWLLFLDADVMPKTQDFISNYINYTPRNHDAIYGGFAYNEEKPRDEFILRWTYGRSNEQVPASLRNKTPYKIVISANFMIKKAVFKRLNSKITQKGYGYDNYFGALLKTENVNVLHIDNEVIHNGLEDNLIYLNKIEKSVDTLLKLDRQNKLEKTENSLITTFRSLKKWRLNYPISWIYRFSNSILRKHLLSQNPKVMVLQFYKLGYICYQDLNS
ncbi:glycosyltransferase family 2 protein [Psychroserpens sp. Hel_I_66]|uniref:glycosyltransferase family 2 protein n=1 Tax=Psychroserpens sp. Hel_I_66 TaxID=1250004 RepID=UPI000648A52A|nr:glycosyltransferase [Psychroserpens sp. Hel_I_66]